MQLKHLTQQYLVYFKDLVSITFTTTVNTRAAAISTTSVPFSTPLPHSFILCLLKVCKTICTVLNPEDRKVDIRKKSISAIPNFLFFFFLRGVVDWESDALHIKILLLEK